MELKFPLPGRGAASNPPSRYLKSRYEAEAGLEQDEDGQPPLPTEVTCEQARTVLSRNDSPDLPFELSLNPYRGCEHGCSYCYARPTHAYLGLSPGLDFETKLTAKLEADRLLREELSAPGYRPRPIALGTNTDPYQPIERRFEITRKVLEVLLEFRHPVTITTKSALVVRDLDLLVALARQELVCVWLSVTSLDPDLARKLEPRASSPRRRLDAIRRLSAAGVPVGVLVAPVIPFLTDSELETILEASAKAGAQTAQWILLRLPGEVAGIFERWLRLHAPERADRILARLRDARGGRLNDPRFGHRFRGEGPIAELLAQRFRVAARRLGLDRPLPPLDSSRFQVPCGQLPLFSLGEE